MTRPPQFSLRLPRWHEWLVYATAGLLVVSGIAWLLLDRFGKIEGEFGSESNPYLPWLLLIHGIGAYAFAIVAAMLVPVHMRLGWTSRRNRRSGLLLVGTSLFLVLTGLGLYYSTAEGLRAATSLAHWLVGLMIPALIIIHLIRGKNSRPGGQRTKSHTL
jgi:hypothetical protein